MRAVLSIRDRKKLGEALAFFVLGTALILYSHELWTTKNPVFMSPYLFPFLIGLCISLLAVSLFVQALRWGASGREGSKEKIPLNWRNVAVVIGFSGIYCAALPFLHFFPATITFLFGLLLILGEKRVWFAVLLALGTTAVMYVIFGLLLSVLLP